VLKDPTMLPITALFAGLLTFYYIRLAFNVIGLRRSNRVSLGAGGHADLESAMRAHGNFAEYVPLGLVLMGLAESLHAEPVILVVLGAALAIGRHWHAQGLVLPDMTKRVRGMKFTFGSLAALAAVNVVYAITTWLA
jgi:uncharacterized membrane protein YecN with MAPEG domain